MLNNINAVIFDLDGTLVDSMWMWKRIDIEFLGERGIELPDDLQRAISGMSFTETATYFKTRFKLEESIEEIKEIWNGMAYDKYMNETPLKQGCLAFLKDLKSRGIKTGIATSNSRHLVESVTKQLSIDTYFDTIRTSCEVKKGKPAPDIYELVASELGVEPKHCLVFEDITQGIMAGKSANMKVCAIEDEYSEFEREEKIRLADYYIKNYDEITR
ncbi:MAG: HAD family phosphatase [bacterium]|nr:HAD family phosphatase [bacterium]